MPRQARIIIPEVAHHITQRGNYRQTIFNDEEDYRKYLNWADEYSKRYNIDIYAYCLMNNHVHFIVVPKDENSLSTMFNTLHMRYAQYKNKKRKANGHLWQGRFFSCILDDAHLYRAIRYIERNPVRAKITGKPWEYRWSSARYHTGLDENSLLGIKHNTKMSGKEWKGYLTEEDDVMNEDIRLKTQRGLVVGSDNFVSNIEKQVDRSLKCLNPGRPKKTE